MPAEKLIVRVYCEDTYIGQAVIPNPSKKVKDFIDQCIERFPVFSAGTAYAVYYVQANRSKIRLGHDETFDEVQRKTNLPQAAMIMFVPNKSSHTATNNLEDLVQTEIYHYDWPRYGGGAKPVFEYPLQCFVEIVQGKEIPVPTTGIVINRDLILNHLTAFEKLKLWISALMGKKRDIDYVSRTSHCEICIFEATQQWQCRIYKPVVIEERLLSDCEFQLAPATTTLRLGKLGRSIRIHIRH
jgi:hypothetical protein